MKVSEISSGFILVWFGLGFFVKAQGLTLSYFFIITILAAFFISYWFKTPKIKYFLVLSNSRVHQVNILICHRTQNMYSQVGKDWGVGTTNTFLKEKGFIPWRQHSRYFASGGILLLKSSNTSVYCLQKQNMHQPILIQPHSDPQRHITVLNLYKWLLHSAPSKNFFC